jgi:hypothetical protein
LTFAPVPQGTQMRWDWELEPLGPFKLVSPLLKGIGRRQEVRDLVERQTLSRARSRTHIADRRPQVS